MKYEILNENYQIRLYGKPQEIKTFLEATDKIFTKSTTITMIQDDLDNIEKIVEKHNFDFGNPNQRLYYNKNEIIYLPNAHNKEAKEFHFEIIQQFFKDIKKEFEKSYELKEIKT